MTYRCPAKVNLFLIITGVRDDGYHLIQTLYQKISLYDELEIQVLGNKQGIHITCPDIIPSGEENLAYRAAQLFKAETGMEFGLRIGIRKAIPPGGGLGGGSSNGAAVLAGLNELFGSPLTTEDLMALGGRLGADVPFFLLDATAALGSGIGTTLTPWPSHRGWYLLVLPDFSISTRWAYENFVLTRVDEDTIFDSRKRIEGLLWQNDLEQSVIDRYPEIRHLKELLIALGANAAMMSGSGSTVFGLFATESKAMNASEILRRRYGYRALVAKGLE